MIGPMETVKKFFHTVEKSQKSLISKTKLDFEFGAKKTKNVAKIQISIL